MHDEIGNALTDADYASLARRWIDKTLADRAGIRRVDSNTGNVLVGGCDQGNYEGKAIPYFLPGELLIREWRLRRDHPDIEYKDGKRKERGKYLSPPGRKNMIYFVPGVSQDLVKAVATPVIVTEGEFKTLSLWRLANCESSVPRFLLLGLGGIRNWQGTIGKTTGQKRDRRDVKGVIPDLDLVVWEGRRVIIAFDADGEMNEQVEIARNLFARELRVRGAEVGVLIWDVTQGKASMIFLRISVLTRSWSYLAASASGKKNQKTTLAYTRLPTPSRAAIVLPETPADDSTSFGLGVTAKTVHCSSGNK